MNIKPECSVWNLWLGREIEGYTQVGEMTLFVRKADEAEILHELKKHKVQRVWFCKEFASMDVIERTLKLPMLVVAVECTLATLPLISQEVRTKAHLYLKLPVELKAGDHICVGHAFEDEAFRLGSGVRVKNKDYSADVRIK